MVKGKAHAREYHSTVREYLFSVPDQRLGEQIAIPWFRGPRLELTVEQALPQAALHGHFHRGQNATRMHDPGGDPPLTDLVRLLLEGKT
jgi:uncharacterized damage-inducible protein DinB